MENWNFKRTSMVPKKCQDSPGLCPLTSICNGDWASLPYGDWAWAHGDSPSFKPKRRSNPKWLPKKACLFAIQNLDSHQNQNTIQHMPSFTVGSQSHVVYVIKLDSHNFTNISNILKPLKGLQQNNNWTVHQTRQVVSSSTSWWHVTSFWHRSITRGTQSAPYDGAAQHLSPTVPIWTFCHFDTFLSQSPYHFGDLCMIAKIDVNRTSFGFEQKKWLSKHIFQHVNHMSIISSKFIQVHPVSHLQHDRNLSNPNQTSPIFAKRLLIAAALEPIRIRLLDFGLLLLDRCFVSGPRWWLVWNTREWSGCFRDFLQHTKWF